MSVAPKKKDRTITKVIRNLAEEGATIELQTEATIKVKKRATLCENNRMKFQKSNFCITNYLLRLQITILIIFPPEKKTCTFRTAIDEVKKIGGKEKGKDCRLRQGAI
jgi:hypothetical protein